MSEEVRRVNRELMYKGTVLEVYRDHMEFANGNVEEWDFIHHNGAAAVIPVTERGEILMVRQYRNALDRYTWEIPAGKLEYGEDPLQCAVRELSEETGFSAGKYTYLGGVSPSPGYCRETIHIYLATELSAGQSHPDENEFLDVVKMPFADAFRLAASNEMTDGKTIIGLLRAAQYLKQES